MQSFFQTTALINKSISFFYFFVLTLTCPAPNLKKLFRRFFRHLTLSSSVFKKHLKEWPGASIEENKGLQGPMARIMETDFRFVLKMGTP